MFKDALYLFVFLRMISFKIRRRIDKNRGNNSYCPKNVKASIQNTLMFTWKQIGWHHCYRSNLRRIPYLRILISIFMCCWDLGMLKIFILTSRWIPLAIRYKNLPLILWISQLIFAWSTYDLCINWQFSKAPVSEVQVYIGNCFLRIKDYGQ